MLPRVLLPVAGLLLAASCAHENEEENFPAPSCKPTNVTYQLTIAPILQGNCLSCHSSQQASGGVVLDEVEQVQQLARQGTLLGVVTHAAGFKPMPKGGAQLNACDIAAIRTWVEAGAPNN